MAGTASKRRRIGDGRGRGAARAGSPRGIALMEAILAGLILGVGLAVVISLTGRSLTNQTDGEKQMVAAWLVDELLSMVLVEGPVAYPKLYDTRGRFDPPFEDFYYDVNVDDRGLGEPFGVLATVRWRSGRDYRSVQAETLIAERPTDIMNPDEIRAPLLPLDRMSRWYDDEEQ
jgi:hypothetical protein